MDIILNYKMFNPVFYHAWDFLHDRTKREFFALGGSRSGKTYSISQALLLYMLHYKVNILVYRKTRVSIGTTVYNDFINIINSFGLKHEFFCSLDKLVIRHHKSGNVIDFSGIDDPEKIKGLSKYKILFNNELTAMDHADYKQQNVRLGGMTDLKLMHDFNPIDEMHWIKTEIFDNISWENISCSVENGMHPVYTSVIEKSQNKPKEIEVKGQLVTIPANTVFVKTSFEQNWWIVGSPVKYDFGFVDLQYIAMLDGFKLSDYNFYRIYALGDWGKAFVGFDFYRFDIARDTERTYYNSQTPIILSFDENSLPYMACTVWQADGKSLRQIDEICLKSPRNNVDATVREFCARYWRHNSTIYVCGDATSKKRSTLLKYGDNWYSVIIDIIMQHGFKDVRDVVLRSNYSVKLRGTFINKIFTENFMGLSIKIDQSCRETITDLKYVQEKADGTKVKEYIKDVETRAKMQKYGHCFVGETLIYGEDSPIRIDKIKVGDLVHTRKGLRKVTKVFDNGLRIVRRYVINSKEVICTPYHKFFCNGKFKEICKIGKGKFTGINYEFESYVIPYEYDRRRVYDIEVEGEHEYFANGILVHNCTDTLKDFIVSAFNDEFKKFLDRFSYKPKSVSLINRQNDRNLG